MKKEKKMNEQLFVRTYAIHPTEAYAHTHRHI